MASFLWALFNALGRIVILLAAFLAGYVHGKAAEREGALPNERIYRE